MDQFGYRAWLQPSSEALGFSPRITGLQGFACDELVYGLDNLFGRKILEHGPDNLFNRKVNDDDDYIISLEIEDTLGAEAYCLQGDAERLRIVGGDEKGLLYGVYGFLKYLRLGQPAALSDINKKAPTSPCSCREKSSRLGRDFLQHEKPAVARRVLNQWDNADGTVERGYAGASLFFKDGKIGYDIARLKDYARLLASVGINELCVNNVNVTRQSAALITEAGLPDLARVADVFRPFGIRLIVSVHFDSPVLLGGIETADPVHPEVALFWEKTAESVYKHIPDLAGFLMKADSEFRSGPKALGRTQADGANVIAKALAPFGGVIYWRCFIYNCVQDWRDTKTDRPMAAYKEFFPLDGKFADNVILQVKHGPSDFQVREPNSPLLGAMTQTQQALEFQISQEYTGQQKDLYATAVQWEEILNTPVTGTRVTRDLAGREITAIAAVANTGTDANWTGHLLAQANLYAFGQLAWNPARTAAELTREWAVLTFGTNPKLIDSLTAMILASRHVYEKYNAPLGIGWMVNISHHYGPSPEGYEYMKWGTYHRATHSAIGVDRTAQGTGFTIQYHPYVRALYEDKNTCPEKLLLFFHRLPYSYRLRSGQTIIQYIYDTHFEGVEDVEGFIREWEQLRTELPAEAFTSVRERLDMQLRNAKEWRDTINNYFYRLTEIPDEKGRLIYG